MSQRGIVITKPLINSHWIDARKTDVPATALDKAAGDGPYRRIVKVVGCANGRSVCVDGMWQEQREGEWKTLTKRTTYCDIKSFWRKYQELDDKESA